MPGAHGRLRAGHGAPVPAGAHRRERRRAALPRLAEGVRLPPVLRRVSEFLVSEFALLPGGRVHQAELKAGFAAAPDYYALDTDPASTPTAIDPARVRRPDRAASTPTASCAGTPRPGAGASCGSAPRSPARPTAPRRPEATGLEVDKLDGGAVRRYLDTYLGAVRRRRSLDALLSDSIESGPQNCTDRLRERFAELRGYDPLPWLPALAGLRRRRRRRAPTASCTTTGARSPTCWPSEYYGTLAAEAHARGLTYYAEALEDHRPQLGDDLAMRSHADVPMGAMWLFDAGTGRPKPTYVADLKGASSVAHVLRQAVHRRRVDDRLPPPVELHAAAAQARRRPRARPRRDPVLHPHLAAPADAGAAARDRPGAVPRPGVHPHRAVGRAGRPVDRLPGPLLVAAQPGRARRSTSRCSSARRRRSPALFGEEPDRSVPGRVRLRLRRPRRPRAAGSPSRTATWWRGRRRYRLLYLGGSQRADDGARAAPRWPSWSRPAPPSSAGGRSGSPSLADDDAEHAALCDRLWGTGRVVDTDDLAAALGGPGASVARRRRAPTCCGSAGGRRPARWCSWPTRRRSR